MTGLFDKYKEALLTEFESDSECFLFWKGRVALYSILKAIDIKPGDEVIMPGFTCVVVPNAVIYLGAKPVYADIERDTLNASLDSIKKLITDKTKAVIVQNTFGLSSELEELAKWAKEEGITSIEDCTHGFGGSFNNRPNGSFCDAAFYSTQWNKPFSTGIGGFAISSNSAIKINLRAFSDELQQPVWSEVLSLRLQVFIRKHFLKDWNYWLLLDLYRKLTKANILTGSSSGGEIEGLKKPQNYWKAMSLFQAKTGLEALKGLKQQMTERNVNARLYTDFLKSKKKYHVPEEHFGNHSFLRYPVLVKNRAEFMEKARLARIQLGDWFISALHPVEGDLSPWYFDQKNCPNAVYIAEHIVNLPMHSNTDKLVRFMEANLEDII